MKSKKHIKALPVKDLSGYNPKSGAIPFMKKSAYFIVTNISITGDAPKDFIRCYEFGKCNKTSITKWPLYIAKLGHKHYCMESITEYLLNRIGATYGFCMADSKLVWLGGQIRFLSRYFLHKPNELIMDHGADLYSGYLNDSVFVEEIESKHLSPLFFTVQFTHETLKHFFPDNCEDLMQEFIKLLILDALIGNNDRHFYNWAVIKDIYNLQKPVFSPIYDTARGLFWNEHEKKIVEIFKNKTRLHAFIKSYCESSKPKVGWEKEQDLNHFDLIERIVKSGYFKWTETCSYLSSDASLEAVIRSIRYEFRDLISEERMVLIVECLKYRHEKIKNILLLHHDKSY